MQIKVRNTAEAAMIDLVDPSVDPPAVVSSRTVSQGSECTITLPDVHDSNGVQFGDPVVSEPASTGDASGGEQPAASDQAAAGEQPPAEEPATDTPGIDLSQVPAGLAVNRLVLYRPTEGQNDIAAIVTCTAATIDGAAVNAGSIPNITGPSRVHLTVFSCAVDQPETAGVFQHFNVPQYVESAESPDVVPGTWRWPQTNVSAEQPIS